MMEFAMFLSLVLALVVLRSASRAAQEALKLELEKKESAAASLVLMHAPPVKR